MAKLLQLSRPSKGVGNVVRAWLAAKQQKRRRERNAAPPDAPVGLSAPGEADWSLERQGDYAVATFLGQEPEPGTNWEAQFRTIGDLDWLDAGSDLLGTPLAQVFDPWPHGRIEARVRYTDGAGTPKSDWSVPRQLG